MRVLPILCMVCFCLCFGFVVPAVSAAGDDVDHKCGCKGKKKASKPDGEWILEGSAFICPPEEGEHEVVRVSMSEVDGIAVHDAHINVLSDKSSDGGFYLGDNFEFGGGRPSRGTGRPAPRS